ncbi:hypothetical protein O6H91_Y548900 [Diphasiastrum complanatum]|nr:hypothetical protein O6H91_Y548900 [Diphasiastrum complanatum]
MQGTILWQLRPWIGKLPSSLQLRFDPGLLRATRPAWGGCLAGVRCEASEGRIDDDRLGNCMESGRGKARIIPRVVHMENKKKKISSIFGSFGSRACVHVPAARGRFLAEIESIREEANPDPVQFESPLAVILYPDPRLRLKNKRINVFDENLQQLVDEMFDVMYR